MGMTPKGVSGVIAAEVEFTGVAKQPLEAVTGPLSATVSEVPEEARAKLELAINGKLLVFACVYDPAPVSAKTPEPDSHR